ncbi:MAG: hypothetical protein JWP48_7251 [Actinoallomurus sp.]|jgi:hypothetical protein|nr:hypothetical protein [Actinoallomurus sp.]
MTRSPRRLREQVRDTVSELPIHAARFAVMGVGRALLLTDRVRKDYREARESGLGPVLGRLKDDAENITGMVVGKVSSNGKTAEEPKRRTAGDSEISVGKPRPAATSRPAPSSQRPAAPARPAASPPARPASSRPKPPAAKPAGSKPASAKPATARPAASKPATKPAAKPATAKPTAAKAKPPESKPVTAPKADAKPKTATADKPSAAKPKTAESKPATGAAGKNLPLEGYDDATLASVRARLRGLDIRQVTELRDYERSHAARADFLRMYENRIAKLRGDH